MKSDSEREKTFDTEEEEKKRKETEESGVERRGEERSLLFYQVFSHCGGPLFKGCASGHSLARSLRYCPPPAAAAAADVICMSDRLARGASNSNELMPLVKLAAWATYPRSVHLFPPHHRLLVYSSGLVSYKDRGGLKFP